MTLFEIYRASIAQPALSHETLRPEERRAWIAWTVRARKEFLAVHPEFADAHGGVAPAHHDLWLDWCCKKYPARRTA